MVSEGFYVAGGHRLGCLGVEALRVVCCERVCEGEVLSWAEGQGFVVIPAVPPREPVVPAGGELDAVHCQGGFGLAYVWATQCWPCLVAHVGLYGCAEGGPY